MNGSRAVAWASVPAAAGVAWRRYRRTARLVESHSAIAPELPGERRNVAAPWGSVAYRIVTGDPSRPPLVLVHGWGKTADAAWWPIVADCTRTMLLVDLPGHGHSDLHEPFSFDLAARSVQRAIDHADVHRPVLVGHSMGGPVVFTAVRRAGPGAFSGVVALATSAYWVRPRLRLILSMAPYVMTGRSPVLLHRQHSELLAAPDRASHIAWSYSRRPVRSLLKETAVELRGFDARDWNDFALPPTTWVVATDDGVIHPRHQHASARHFRAEVVELPLEHAMLVRGPRSVLEVLEDSGI